ncbi:MAG TPA: polysaccharide lyase family 8 super-sandwich domain-containing protein [Thermoanaerobaculia bacterium]
MRFLGALVLSLFATVSFAADIDVVRQNFIDYYTAAGADRSAPRMAEAIGGLESHARQITAPGFLLSDGSWSDINYAEKPDGGWSPWEHSRRLIVMAKAYRTPGQPLYGNATLRAQIESALAYTKNFYGATILPQGNWWFWTIGIPLDLAPTLVLMRGDISQQVYDDLVLAIQLRIGPSPTSRGIIGPTPTGQNLAWSSYTHLCLALLKDDVARLGLVRDAMAKVTLPATGEGIKADASFHQHGAQLYTGGYGGSFANDVAKYALFTRNTQYGLPASSLATFSDYMADGVAWSLYGNYFDVSVISREVARESTTGYNGIAALLQASTFDSPRAAEIRSATRRMLQTWTWGLPTELAGLAVIAERSRWTPEWPEGHRHYYNSDYTVHRRDGWFASIKMFSTRTKSGESTNQENLRGARQSDGRFYLSLRGDEWFGRNVWPALDWTRLPGTTVEQKPTTADASYGYGTRSLAGGTGDGQNGVSAMELSPLNSTLFAKKSWFFFDDAIVFLTNSITAPMGNRVETVVNQWPLLSNASQVTSGSDWSVLEGVGTWYPSAQPVQTTRETRSGAWADLGGSSDTTQHTRTFVTTIIDHGTSPTNATAEYVIVPNVTATTMRTWAASRPFDILANTTSVSAVRDRRTWALGIVFWSAASIDGISSDAPAVVYMTSTAKTINLSVADPNAGATGVLRITVPGRYRATGAKATAGVRATTIEIPKAGGQTTRVLLETLTIPKRRAAGR